MIITMLTPGEVLDHVTDYVEDCQYTSVRDLTLEDVTYLAQDTGCSLPFLCELINIKVPKQ